MSPGQDGIGDSEYLGVVYHTSPEQSSWVAGSGGLSGRSGIGETLGTRLSR